MRSLRELETDAQLEVPVETGRAIKALSTDPQHRLAWRFIIDQLSGQRRLSFVPGMPESHEMTIWREGRRFVGEWLTRIAEAPMAEETPPESPARTMTERVRRASRNSQQPKG